MRILIRTATRARRPAATLYALALLLPLACAPAFAVPPEDATRVLDRWAAAYSANDTSAVLKLYAPDAILFGTARPIIFDGTKPIGAAFASLPESGNTARICRRQVLVVGDDSVLVTGSYEFQTLEHGMRGLIYDRFTMLIVKREGDWQISYHTTSHLQPGQDSSTGRTTSIGRQTSALPISPADAGQDSLDACRR
jgi:uncharacterized protein (TIGR02246 family)